MQITKMTERLARALQSTCFFFPSDFGQSLIFHIEMAFHSILHAVLTSPLEKELIKMWFRVVLYSLLCSARVMAFANWEICEDDLARVAE